MRKYWKIAVFITVVILAVYYGRFSSKFRQPAAVSGEVTSTPIADSPQIGGSFSLTSHEGKQVSDVDFRGKYMLVYFGFTSCPMVCPTDMAKLTNLIKGLSDEEKAKLAPIFITVDPERDTPEKMKDFLKSFDPAIIGLTGAEDAVKFVESSYKVYSQKAQADDNGNYNVDHSAFFYLMDGEGKFIQHFTSEDSAEKIASQIENQINNTK